MNVAPNKIVTLEYELTDEGGSVLDSSRGHQPLRYLHGAGSLLPALEAALVDREPGDRVQAVLPPEQAYGEVRADLRQTVPRERFGGDTSLEVGMQFRGPLDDGHERIFTVVAIRGDEIAIDGNHPLAGRTLNFDVEVLEVRDATADEIAHGHPHGPGGAHDH